jgi:hypothetical protein
VGHRFSYLPKFALGIALFVCGTARAAPPASVRIDALADTGGRSDFVVSASGAGSAVTGEALIWTGATPDGPLQANALTAALAFHDSRNVADVRLGRFTLMTGAIRPVQLDGASMLVRSPWGTKVEAFGGAPVIPVWGPRDFDWIAGGRLSQTIASRVILGVSYVQRRQGTDVAQEEVGTDLSAMPAKWLDLAARASFDLSSPGVKEALASAAMRGGPIRFEVYASDRSPSRLLPDTSLFSIFGDFPSQSVGANLHWKAAPRLDMWLSGAGQSVGGVYGGNASARALLKLDDKGAGAIGVQVLRQDVSTAKWTGVRLTATEPFLKTLRASTELELVVPDDQSKGSAWPWALVSLGWRPHKTWELGGALVAASTPQYSFELIGLARLSLFWVSK